ncbi:hypothetical protein V6N13_130483 [Hibiscus sabdariffa]
MVELGTRKPGKKQKLKKSNAITETFPDNEKTRLSSPPSIYSASSPSKQYSCTFILYINWVFANALLIVYVEWHGDASLVGSHLGNFIAISCATSFEMLSG